MFPAQHLAMHAPAPQERRSRAEPPRHDAAARLLPVAEPCTLRSANGRVRDGMVARKVIAAGPVSGGRREVRSGLTGGESVVLDPPPGLAEGAKVNVVTK